MMFKIILAISMSIAALTKAMLGETGGDMIYVEPETMVEVTTEETEYIPAVTEETTIAVVEPSTTSYYNVNLPTEIQDVIFTECEKYAIPPSIVVAMIERESTFNPNAIGDNGNSFGLMQIQPRWHSGRMAKLGCTDLLDPIQNVTVGIDFLGELYIRYGDIRLALTAYNTGNINNGLNGYAIAVMARANEVEYAKQNY